MVYGVVGMNFIIRLLSVLYLSILSASAHTLIDFDKMVSDCVIEEKQIVIPGHPFAFNPSIVRWSDGRLLLAFRERDTITGVADLIGFIWFYLHLNSKLEFRI